MDGHGDYSRGHAAPARAYGTVPVVASLGQYQEGHRAGPGSESGSDWDPSEGSDDDWVGPGPESGHRMAGEAKEDSQGEPPSPGWGGEREDSPPWGGMTDAELAEQEAALNSAPWGGESDDEDLPQPPTAIPSGPLEDADFVDPYDPWAEPPRHHHQRDPPPEERPWHPDPYFYDSAMQTEEDVPAPWDYRDVEMVDAPPLNWSMEYNY